MINNVQGELKIIVLLTVLVVIFLLQSLSIINDQYSKKKSLEGSQKRLVLAIKLSDILHETQKERGMAVGFVSSKGKKFAKQLRLQYSLSDKAIKRLRTYIKTSDEFSNSKSIKACLQKISQIKRLRQEVRKLTLTFRQTLTRYTSINNEILKLIAKIVLTTGNLGNISQKLVAYINFLYLKENAGIERAVGTNILLSKEVKKKYIKEFYSLIIKQKLYENIFLEYSNKDIIQYYKSNLTGDFIKSVEKIQKIILSENIEAISKIDVKVWFSNATKKIDKLRNINRRLTQDIIFYIQNELENTKNKVFLFLVINVLSLAIYIFIVVLILKFIKQDKIQKDFISKHIIISTTDTKGIITGASEAFAEISGYSKEELIGKPHNIVRHPDMSKELFRDMWATIKSGKIWRGNIKNRKKDGGYYWVNASVEPIFGKNDEIVSYMAVRQNITDKMELDTLNKNLQSKIESEVEKSREKDKAMLQQSRLAQMGEMLSMIAHQWRQPLSAISTTSANLILKAKLGVLDNESAIKLAEKISAFTQHLSDTIDDFRNFFKPDKTLEDVTYSKLVQCVLNIVEDSLKTKNIQLKVDIQSDVVFKSYPNELKQVILNLVKNAEDVLLEREVKNSTITIEAYGNQLRVKDNAGGVPESIIDKIFDPYFSTKTQKNGTGIGLYMSKTIVEDHCKGELKVYNDEEGAVFEIELPI